MCSKVCDGSLSHSSLRSGIIDLMNRLTLLALAILSCLFLVSPDAALAKSYSIPLDTFKVQINADKSVTVIERLTYDFEGSFSWAEMWVPTRFKRQGYRYDARVTNFSVESTDGSPVELVTYGNEPSRFYAKWTYSAQDEQKTFLISYTIENAVRKYPEAAEFYWRIIGEDWDVPHGAVTVVVTLPEAVDSIDQLNVYGHGPLSGQSTIVDTQTARFTADSVAATNFG